jgi:hypothetical protein
VEGAIKIQNRIIPVTVETGYGLVSMEAVSLSKMISVRVSDCGSFILDPNNIFED